MLEGEVLPRSVYFFIDQGVESTQGYDSALLPPFRVESFRESVLDKVTHLIIERKIEEMSHIGEALPRYLDQGSFLLLVTHN